MVKENTLSRLPAEWEKHEATWIGWPHNTEDWPGKFSPIPWVYSEIVRRISPGEKVRIFVEDKTHEKKARNVLKAANVDSTNIEFYTARTDRGWMRDIVPAFVRYKSGLVMAEFMFNGWAKYSNHKKDQKIPAFISKKIKASRLQVNHKGRNVVLEGGGIDINGKGTLITTEECLMSEKLQVRNPDFTKKDYENIFRNYLGITKVLWLGNGIAGDDTHGHVDDVCRFVNNSTLLLVQENNSKDDNYINLNENRERVQDFRLSDGSKVHTEFLPMPGPVIFKGQRLPASYANFYIANSAVLVPTFNDPNDKKALGIIGELINDRPVIGIHALDLVWGLGTLHCLTHEQPTES